MMALLVFPFLWKITWNLMNVKYDAYRIEHLDKQIRHSINFLAYLGVNLICIWLSAFRGWEILIFLFAGFFCRQITFDIPLNLSRGKTWDYVTPAPPKNRAVTDSIEIWLFGRNGKLPVYIYTILWITLEILLIIKNTKS